jgi:archaeosine-15-forming tRNA-guanine transglycosylase
MRILRLAVVPVVVRIRRRDEVTVVVPADTTSCDVLAAARLVLSGDEFAELETAIADPQQMATTQRR